MPLNHNQHFSILRNLAVLLLLTFVCFIFYSFINFSLFSQSKTLNQEKNKISFHYSYLVANENNTPPETIISQLNAFTYIKANDIPFNFNRQDLWFIINIEKYTDTFDDIVLHAENSMLSSFDVYDITEIQQPKLLTTINHDNNNRINQKVFPHVNLNFAGEVGKKLLLRVHTEGSPNVPLKFYQETVFKNKINTTEVIFGCFIGITLLMVMYNLVFYFAIKSKLYLLYVAYLSTIFLTLSITTGLGHYLYSNDLHALLSRRISLLHYLNLIFIFLFTLEFLEYAREKSKHYRYGLMVIGFIGICALASLILSLDTSSKIFFTILPFILCYTMFLIFRKIKTTFSWARFYFISWLPFCFYISLQILAEFNLLKSSLLSSNGFLFIIMFEIVFLAFALAERMKKSENIRLNNIRYHVETLLPRKNNLEHTIINVIQDKVNKLSVLAIKPEQIEYVSLYMDEHHKSQLLIDLNSALQALLKYNDAVLPLTNKNEKIVLLEPYALGVLVNDNTNQQDLEDLIESIQHVVQRAYKIKGFDIPLSAKIGVSCYPENTRNASELINQALLTVNNLKSHDADWLYYNNNSRKQDNYWLNMAENLSVAIDNDELELYHQPQIDLKTSRVCGSECLLRWYYQGEGFIAPEIFVPVAEDIGLIKKLSRWVIKQALIQHKTLMENGYASHKVSINISSKDITHHDFTVFISNTLYETGIPAEKVILELSEATLLLENKSAITILNELIALGLNISIDDFGTQYSSIAQLCDIPCQELKMDPLFINKMKSNNKHQVICSTTIKMAKGLSLDIVAEGINSSADEALLRDYGCDIGQGHYYAEAMSLEKYLLWLEKAVNGKLPEGEIIS